MRSFFKKIIKYFFYILGALITISLLIIFGAWLKYTSIVDPKPTNSNEYFTPDPYGKFVNNFIGTGGFPAWVCGMNFPGATVPFGMVRLSPETISLFPENNLLIPDKKALNTSGYYYGDNRMLGFSHTRLAGTGATDGGFKDENIFTELTATKRTGLHRYTFKDNSNKSILIKISNSTGDRGAKNANVTIYPDQNKIEGSVRTFGTFAGRYKGQKIYFVAKFDQEFSAFGIWDGTNYGKNSKIATSDNLIINLSFNDPILNVKVGISYVSIENARLNLDLEVGDQSFDEIVEKAKQSWEDKLALIKINGGTEEEQRIFYSALYRSFQMPTLYNDVNGNYIGFDNQIHRASGFNYYTDLSLWDTFRTIHPLFNLIAREEQRDMIVSLIQMAKQGGSLPRWPSGNGYTGSMLGSPADMTITEAYLKGIKDFDINFAYKTMKEVAIAPTPKGSEASGRRGVEGYIKYGYCPDELGDESVAICMGRLFYCFAC